MRINFLPGGEFPLGKQMRGIEEVERSYSFVFSSP